MPLPWGEKARAYIRLFSSFRANHSNQGRRSGDVDAVTFPTAHNRTANGIQLELPPGGKVFLHGAAYARGQAIIDRLNMDRLDLAASTSAPLAFATAQASAIADINLRFHSASA